MKKMKNFKLCILKVTYVGFPCHEKMEEEGCLVVRIKTTQNYFLLESKQLVSQGQRYAEQKGVQEKQCWKEDCRIEREGDACSIPRDIDNELNLGKIDKCDIWAWLSKEYLRERPETLTCTT